MKVRLKSGQRITLTPDVFVAAMGVEEPEKILKWKKEYMRENVAKRQEEMDKLRKEKTPTGETEEQREARILKQLQAQSKELNITRQEKYGNELKQIGIDPNTGRSPGGEGSFLSKVFGREGSRKASKAESEVADGNDTP